MSKKSKKVNKNVSVCTIEQAAVTNRSYEYYSVALGGYLKTNDALTHVKVVSVIFDLKQETVTSILQDSKGDQYVRVGHYDMYASVYDFERNIPMDHYNSNTASILVAADAKHGDNETTSFETETGEKKIYMSVYIFEDNQAVRVPVEINVVRRAIVDGHFKWELVEGQFPDEYWDSYDKAFANNEYTVIDEDGEQFVERGKQLRIKLTDEQMKIVERFRQAFKDAKAAGLKFVWDRDNCGDVEVYNDAEIVSVEYDGCPVGGGDICHIGELELTSIGVDFFDYNGCDNYVFQFKPTPRQQKAWNKNHNND